MKRRIINQKDGLRNRSGKAEKCRLIEYKKLIMKYDAEGDFFYMHYSADVYTKAPVQARKLSAAYYHRENVTSLIRMQDYKTIFCTSSDLTG
jgi:hypothetical protein